MAHFLQVVNETQSNEALESTSILVRNQQQNQCILWMNPMVFDNQHGSRNTLQASGEKGKRSYL